jgi:photosystem II stability/assembly factor-like uncharacterized protein
MMKPASHSFVINRRAVLGGLGLTMGGGRALAATGIRALDEPAIRAKAPDRVNLIAIARAGARLVAVGEHGVITYSDDNGASWTQASVPVTVTLTCVAFASKLQGWAAGHYGVILHTNDGGQSWQEQLNGIQANQLTMAAANQAMAQTNGADMAQRAMRRANFFNQAGPDKPFLTIYATSPDDAMIFGAYRMVMKTSDGGKTWVDWSLHIGDPLSHNLYDVAAVGPDIFIAGELGLIYRSSDGGNSFPEVTSPVATTMFGIADTGNGGVMVVGVAGAAYRSDDQGMTWRQLQMDAGANLVAARTLASGAIVVASEDGALYMSSDHAETFRPMPMVEPMAIFDLTQAANGDIVLVGNLGVASIQAQLI